MVSRKLVRPLSRVILVGRRLILVHAALFPGVNFFLSCWYKRSEFGLRAAVFFSAAAASGSFGGLLSVGLAQAGGTAGYEAWRWIFILLGLISVACSLISFWLCHDYPPQAKFLTEREREYAVARLRADDQYSAAGEHFQWKYVAQALSDPKVRLSDAVGRAMANSDLLCRLTSSPSCMLVS